MQKITLKEKLQTETFNLSRRDAATSQIPIQFPAVYFFRTMKVMLITSEFFATLANNFHHFVVLNKKTK